MLNDNPLQEIPLLVLQEPYGDGYDFKANYFYGMSVAEMNTAGIELDDVELTHYRRMQMFGLHTSATVVRHNNMRLMFPYRSIYGVFNIGTPASMRLFFVCPYATLFMLNGEIMDLPASPAMNPNCSLDALISQTRVDYPYSKHKGITA